jgi:mortality factor 4-like protein 1
MAPQKQAPSPFQKDERVLCFHLEMLYEAKIMDVMAPETSENGWLYKVHYKGWKSTWDDWVGEDRIRKFTDENKDLASQLLAQYKMLQSGKTTKPSAKKGPAASRAPNGSDMSSARGSEERTAGATTATGRGPRRARDYELEQVSACVSGFLGFFYKSFLCFFSLRELLGASASVAAPVEET